MFLIQQVATLSSKMSDSDGDSPPPAKKGGKQAIEQIYQKKSQLEHILLRPDTYIGTRIIKCPPQILTNFCP
jgi:hypothetical protein